MVDTSIYLTNISEQVYYTNYLLVLIQPASVKLLSVVKLAH